MNLKTFFKPNWTKIIFAIIIFIIISQLPLFPSCYLKSRFYDLSGSNLFDSYIKCFDMGLSSNASLCIQFLFEILLFIAISYLLPISIYVIIKNTKKIIKQTIIFSILFFFFLFIINLILSCSYPNFSHTIRDYFENILGMLFDLLIIYIVCFIPLVAGESFLYKIKNKSKKYWFFLPLLIYISFLILELISYFILRIKHGPSEGLVEVFIIYSFLFYAPILIIIYSIIRLLLFNKLIKKGSNLITIIGLIDKYYKKIFKIMLISIIFSGTLFAFDQFTKGKFLKFSLSYWRYDYDKDAPTYEILIPNSPYAKDANHVYYSDEIIAGADPDTFVILESLENFSKDKNYVYNCDRKEDVADAESFEFLKTEEGLLTYFAKDKYNIYQIHCDPPRYIDDLRPIENADYQTFKVISKYEAKDKNRNYRR